MSHNILGRSDPDCDCRLPDCQFLAFIIDGILQGVVLRVPYLGILVIILYSLVKDALPFLNGQSIGKRVMGIRAVKDPSRDPIANDYGAAIARQISLYIPFFNIIDAFMVFS